MKPQRKGAVEVPVLSEGMKVCTMPEIRQQALTNNNVLSALLITYPKLICHPEVLTPSVC